MPEILVTGGTGYIGQRVLSGMVERGWRPHAIVRDSRKLSHLQKSVDLHHCDLFGTDRVRSVIRELQPKVLLHLAWTTEHGKFWSCDSNLSWLSSTAEMLRAFAEHGGERYVGAGTCAEYSWSKGGCLREDAPRVPHTLYGTCKNAAFQVASEFCRLNQIQHAWGRVFFLYGPGEDHRRLIPSIATPLLKGSTAACHSSNFIRDFMHVDDVADAFVTLVDSRIEGPVNIGSGIATSLGSVAEEIAELVGAANRIELGRREPSANDPLVLVADTTRLQSELNWRPRISLSAGLRQMVQHLETAQHEAAA